MSIPVDAEMSPAEVLGSYPAHFDTVPSLLTSRAGVQAETPALRFGTRSCWTYSQLMAGVESLASALAAKGIVRGERVAHVGSNSDVTVVLFLALARIGSVFVPMNPVLTDDELRYQLEHSGAKVIAGDDQFLLRWSAVAESLPGDPWCLPLSTIGLNLAGADDVLGAIRDFQVASGSVRPGAPPAPEDPLVVIYTSGTTGRSKGVVHTHRSFVLSAEAFVGRLHLQPSDKLLTVFPLFHANALFYSLGGALAAGATFIATARFSASSFWQLALAVEATQLNILASLGKILSMRSRSEFEPHHRIRKIYGGPISAEMMRVFQEEFHVPTLIEGYGMSEIPAACCNPFAGPHKVGSIGLAGRHPLRAGPFAEMRVTDDDGRDVTVGEVGELIVRTPVMFVGYLNDPDQTASAFRDGWFLTGDYVRRDRDGYLYFVSRKKDVIRRRGENIAGAEIDRVVGEHPDVAEVAAIGVPSELGDEEILIAVVIRAGRTLTHESLARWCTERLAAMKQPRFIAFIPSLPQTPTHRVAKHVLRQDAELSRIARDMLVPSRRDIPARADKCP
jgi:crotonobetaine/carnitine-CoA ligase